MSIKTTVTLVFVDNTLNRLLCKNNFKNNYFCTWNAYFKRLEVAFGFYHRPLWFFANFFYGKEAIISIRSLESWNVRFLVYVSRLYNIYLLITTIRFSSINFSSITNVCQKLMYKILYFLIFYIRYLWKTQTLLIEMFDLDLPSWIREPEWLEQGFIRCFERLKIVVWIVWFTLKFWNQNDRIMGIGFYMVFRKTKQNWV